MITKLSLFFFITSSVCTLVGPSAYASDKDFYLDLSLGLEQDNNVTVSDIDLASGLNDLALLFRAKANAKFDLAKDVQVKTNYVYSAKDYDEFSQFDQNYHLASVDLNHKVGKTRIGVTGRYLDASLNGDAYLQAKQFSPYLSRYFGRKFFARASYTYSDRTYKLRPERDGDTHGLGLSAYHFLTGTRQFIILGYRFEDVDASERQLAYDKHHIQAEYIRRFPLWQDDTTLKLSAKYESRDYKDINFVINEERQDDRFTYGASWKIPAFANSYIELDLKFRDYRSNLSLVDYDKTVFGVRIGHVF